MTEVNQNSDFNVLLQPVDAFADELGGDCTALVLVVLFSISSMFHTFIAPKVQQS